MSTYVVTCSGHLGVDGLTADSVDALLWLAQGRLGFALPTRVRGEDGWYCYRSQEDADGDPDGSGAALVVERQGESSLPRPAPRASEPSGAPGAAEWLRRRMRG